MFEWIGIGLMIAIGFYVAPMVIMLVVGIVAVIVAGIKEIFTGSDRR